MAKEQAPAVAGSDRRRGDLIAASADWLWESDADGRVNVLSPEFEASTGVSPRSLLGRTLAELASADAGSAAQDKQRAATAAVQPFRDLLFKLERADGAVTWVEISGAAIFDADGFCGYHGMGKVVTAEVEATEALRESEQQARQLLDAAADYYWEQDTKYYHSYISPSYQKLLGLPAAEVLGKRLMEVADISVDYNMGVMALKAHKEKRPYRDFVYSRKMPDGTKRWFKSSGAPVYDRQGAFIGYRGVGADITKHVEAEALSRLGEQRLHEAVAYVTQPIVVYDTEDKIVTFNQVFWDLHVAQGDYARTVGQGVSFRMLSEWQLKFNFYASGPDDAAVDLETLLSRYESEAEHVYHLSNDRWMMVVYRRLPGGGRVGLWTEITAIKRAEAERSVLEAQLAHSQRLEALGTLAGGAAHEINNALVPTIALTKLVAKKLPADSRERRNLEMAVTGAERSRDLVKQILAFSRKGEVQALSDSVDVGAVLRASLEFMRATVPTNIRFAEEIAPVPAIAGDPSQLRQVIINVMINAAQAIGGAQGSITASLSPEADGAQLRLSIADTGSGMDEATLSRVFEPFFTTKPVGEGAGLGLSVAYGIVKAHGGRLEAKSTAGQGSRFDIVLPVTATRANQVA
jgi:PAS domain S-box-containing protein